MNINTALLKGNYNISHSLSIIYNVLLKKKHLWTGSMIQWKNMKFHSLFQIINWRREIRVNCFADHQTTDTLPHASVVYLVAAKDSSEDTSWHTPHPLSSLSLSDCHCPTAGKTLTEKSEQLQNEAWGLAGSAHDHHWRTVLDPHRPPEVKRGPRWGEISSSTNRVRERLCVCVQESLPRPV